MGQEPRRDAQVIDSSKHNLRSRIWRYILSTVVIGHEDDNSVNSPNNDGNTSVIKTSAVDDRVNEHSNERLGRDDSRHQKNSVNSGWDVEYRARHDEEGTREYTSSDTKLSSPSNEFRGSSVDSERYTKESVNDSRSNSSPSAGTTGSNHQNNSYGQSNDSPSPTITTEHIGHDVACEWSDSGCADGSTQDSLSSAGSVVPEVHNKPSQVDWASNIDSSEIIWKWILEQQHK